MMEILSTIFCYNIQEHEKESTFHFFFSFFFPLSQGGLAPGGFNFDAKLLVPFFPFIDSV